MADVTLTFEGGSFEDLAHDLRRAAARFRVETDAALAKIGAELMEAARALAAQHSPKVAATLRIRTLPGMVVISVGDDATPIAALWELGNKGSHDTTRVQGVYFRHPVFGNRDVWVNQRRFPMLRPAQQAMRKQITQRMNEAYDRTLEPYRLKPTEEL